MGKFLSTILSAFRKAPSSNTKIRKLVNGELTYIFNPKTNHTIIQNSNKKMSCIMNGRYPEKSFKKYGLSPNNVLALGDTQVTSIVDATKRIKISRKEGANFWPTLTHANSTTKLLG